MAISEEHAALLAQQLLLSNEAEANRLAANKAQARLEAVRLAKETLIENGITSKPQSEWDALINQAKEFIKTVPVDFLDYCVLRRVKHKTLISVISLKIWVESHPNLRVWLANGRNQGFPRYFRDALSLLAPTNITTFERFYRCDIVL